MRPALTAAVLQLPQQLRRSLTWDHGKETAEHTQFTIDSGVQVCFCFCFCDLRSPLAAWHQREHQRPALPIPPQGRRPPSVRPGRAGRHRRRAQWPSSTNSLANAGAGSWPRGRSVAGPGLACWFVVEPPAGIEPATPSLPWIGGQAPVHEVRGGRRHRHRSRLGTDGRPAEHQVEQVASPKSRTVLTAPTIPHLAISWVRWRQRW
jgi:hypothetical protein